MAKPGYNQQEPEGARPSVRCQKGKGGADLMRDAARAAAGRWLDELTSVRRAEHCHARQRDRRARSASTCRAVAIVAKPMTAPLCRDTSLSSPTHEERRIRQAGFRSVVPL